MKGIKILMAWLVMSLITVLVNTTISGSLVLAQVTEQWVARYNGSGNGYDFATALAVDSEKNVYVTGYSVWSGTQYDYVTIKYNANGSQAWAARYNGQGNGNDVPTALAIDSAGNVYVTGFSNSYGTEDDYATVKYDPNGNLLWVARYSGPGYSYDLAYALAVDAAGNVYVTGESYGSGTGYDYATVKYDPNGNLLWVARYNGASNNDEIAVALAVDTAGNVYVTGYSYDSSLTPDYATVKYNSNGDPLWVARYNGPGRRDDFAYALAVDAAGNAYVTGWSYGAGTGYDYATVKYDSNGDPLWVARYNGPGNNADFTSALAVDTDGNVYVTGGSIGSDTHFDYATLKYDTFGNPLWVARYNGPGNIDDYAYALKKDPAGNVYVTGGSGNGPSTYTDYATIKYDDHGNPLWVARYNGLGNVNDHTTALSLDTTGNVYVTGGSTGLASGYDYATIKYSQANLVNISTRSTVQTKDNVLIGGFIIQGRTPKQALIRARGPSMSGAPFNLSGTLANPYVQLYSFATGTFIVTNDNWEDPPSCSAGYTCGGSAEIIATGLDPCQPNPGQTVAPPNCGLEAAILITLPPGNYGAIVSGGTGLGLVEVFDNDTASASKLGNISTRAFVGTGVNEEIGGFIIDGTSSKQVLIRARGPSMSGAPFNYSGTLANPTVQLYSFAAGGIIAANDNWQNTPSCTAGYTCGGSAEIIATELDPCQPNPGQTVAPPNCGLEAAILITLPPGNYGAIVSGGTGLGLVEVFDVP